MSVIRHFFWRRSAAFLTRATSSNNGFELPRSLDTESSQFSARSHPTVEQVIRMSHAEEFMTSKVYEGQALILGKLAKAANKQVASINF